MSFIRYLALNYLVLFCFRPYPVCRVFISQESIDPNVPSRSDRYMRPGPCQNLWRPTQCPPLYTLLVRGRTCGDWRTAAVSRWWSWCRAARSCWTVREQETGMRMCMSFSFFSPSLDTSFCFHSSFVLFLLKDFLHTFSIDRNCRKNILTFLLWCKRNNGSNNLLLCQDLRLTK